MLEKDEYVDFGKLTGWCEMVLTNGQREVENVRVVMVNTDNQPLWIEDVEGWVYPITSILRIRKMVV